MTIQAQSASYLEHLRGVRAAYVFRKYADLPAATIRRAFSQAMNGSRRHALQRLVREDAKDFGITGFYSFVLFRKESEPHFMKGSGLIDIRHAFLLILELDNFVVVFRHGATFDEGIFAGVMTLLPHEYLTNLFSGAQSAYERIALRSMSVSNRGVSSRTLEAENLKTAMSTIGANRSVPSGFKVRRDDGSHTVTPSTSRIGSQGALVAARDLLHWAKEIIIEIERSKSGDDFMSKFATPCKISDLPNGVIPAGIRLDLSKLLSEVEDGSVRQVLSQKDATSGSVVLDSEGLQELYESALRAFIVIVIGGEYIFMPSSSDEPVGLIKINKSTMTLASDLFDRYIVEYSDGERLTLTRWINKTHDFTVVFSDPRYAYSGKSLWYDNNLSSTIDALLAIFVVGFDLSSATSEKGTLRSNSKNFLRASIFGIIENEIAQEDTVLVCDDLGDEWADFIGLRADGQEPGITFYHAKHGEIGLGASGLHVVVSQALKNLSHLNPAPADIARKCDAWDGAFYKLDGVQSKVARVRRGGSKQVIGDLFRKVLSNPNASRRVYVVVSCISKSEVEAALLSMRGGNSSEPQMVQLLWLLTAFVGMCKDVGANPYIVCNV